jgi:hypothetical protein
MRYENQHIVSGWGRVWNRDRSKSVRVFYVWLTAEAYAGNRDPVRMPDMLHVREMDYRDEKNRKIAEPTWLSEESMLETEDGKSYLIRHDGQGVWHIGLETAPTAT